MARLADGWNANGSLDEFRERRDRLLGACERHERDPAGIEVSAQVMCIGRRPAEIAAVADALVREGVDHLVFVILAADGPDGLHQLSREIVMPLRDRYA